MLEDDSHLSKHFTGETREDGPLSEVMRNIGSMEDTRRGRLEVTVRVPHLQALEIVVLERISFYRQVNLFIEPLHQSLCEILSLFELLPFQDEIHLLGAKVFDMDAYSQMGLVSNKASNHGSTFGLTRVRFITLLS